MTDRDIEPPAGESQFLSRAEVARLFGVSPSTVTRWAGRHLIRAIRTPGGQYRFRTADVREAVRRMNDQERGGE
jgi:excisionase family DNA binding protein